RAGRGRSLSRSGEPLSRARGHLPAGALPGSLAPFGGRALGGRGPLGGLGRGARGGPALVPAHSTATGGGRVLEGCGPGALDGGEGDRVRGSGLLLVLLLVLVVRGRRARGGDAALGRGG